MLCNECKLKNDFKADMDYETSKVYSIGEILMCIDGSIDLSGNILHGIGLILFETSESLNRMHKDLYTNKGKEEGK